MFLAIQNIFLNTQLNASIFLLKELTKFNKSDCVIINESELRNFIKETDIKLNNIVKKLIKLTKTKKVIVTAGKTVFIHSIKI